MPKPSTPTNRKTSTATGTTPTQNSSSQDSLYIVRDVLAQKGDKYLLAWEGTDPQTGKPWKPTWEPKQNCTPALLKSWGEKQAKKEAEGKSKSENRKPSSVGARGSPISITSTPIPGEKRTPQTASKKRASSRLSTATPQKAVKPDTQESEYTPSQPLPKTKSITTPTLRRAESKKRKKSLIEVVPPKSEASESAERRPTSSSKQPTPSAYKPSSLSEDSQEVSRAAKKRRLAHKVIEDSQPDFPTRTAPLSLDPIEVSSVRSPSPAKPASVEPIKESSQKPVPESPRSLQRQSRSRKPTSPPLPPPRNRSLSPVTKVDSWLSIASDNEFSEAIADHETENIQVATQSQDPTSGESSMNPSGQQGGPIGPTTMFNPIQTFQRQLSAGQSNRSVAGSPSPTTSIPSRGPIAQAVRRQSGGQSRRSASGSVASHQSFSAAVGLREKLQAIQKPAIYDQIRKLASFAGKTPSLSSTGTGHSILSGGTSVSSLSTEKLSNLKLVELGEGEKIFAVSGSELQIRMTKGVLVNKQKEIQDFCANAADASDESVNSMKTLISTCSDIATHPYLIITPPVANADLPETKEASYLTASSGKFVALGKLLDALQGDKEVKLGIVVQDVKGVELLDGFLRGKGIRVKRTDGAGVRGVQTGEIRGPNVILVLGGKAGSRAIVNRVDMVIAMDLSFNPENDQILRLRQHPTNLDELVPVIRLVTVNSAEHVRLCLPIPHEIPSDRQMLQGLVSATTILRNFNGVEILNDNERYGRVAEYIRSKGQADAAVFGIRDIEGYMAGHRGLAGLAVKRARDSIDDEGGDRKRVKSGKSAWQQPSMESIQTENDELHDTLAKKQRLNESLRSDLESLQSKFDALTVTKAKLDEKLQQSITEVNLLRNQFTSAPQSDPVFLHGEIMRLTKALESKTKDFEYVSARYQDASVAAADSAAEVLQLKAELEKLKRRVEMDVKAVSWEGEKKMLLERIQELEGRCKLLEDRDEKVQRKHADGRTSSRG